MAILSEVNSSITLLRQFKESLTTSTGITDFSEASEARVYADVFVDQVLSARNEQVQSFYAQQLSRATGKALDRIGQDLGIERFAASFATVGRSELSLAFYVESGTFGAINGGGSITITTGTFVYSDPNENELGTSVRYLLTSDVTCNSGDAIAYASAKAEFTGSGHNVGATVIRNHNFTNYTQVANGSLKILNFYPILNGREEESDERYRFRLAKNYDRLISSNDSKLHLTALRVPGVLDVKVISGYFGIGTAGVLVLGSDYQSNNSLVQSLQSRLDDLAGPGLYAIATGAVQVTLDMTIELIPTRSLTTQEKNRIEAEMRRTLTDQLRAVSIGGSLSLQTLGASVQQKGKGLVTLGQEGSQAGAFKQVYMLRSYSNSINSERDQLISDTLSLQPDEFVDIGTVTFTYSS